MYRVEIFSYTFRDESLLEEALTVPSYRMQHPEATDNQRLEFLGDAVLGLLSARRVYDEFPSAAEGPLTVRRTHMVSAAALCAAACRHGLAAHLRRNLSTGELPSGSKTLADAVEAVLGAAYLDGGLDAARQMFDALELLPNAEEGAWSENPKGDLQVRAQAMKPPRHPVYELLETAGKAHAPIFTVRVTVEGIGSEVASAGGRKEAEALAAAKLLERGCFNGRGRPLSQGDVNGRGRPLPQ